MTFIELFWFNFLNWLEMCFLLIAPYKVRVFLLKFQSQPRLVRSFLIYYNHMSEEKKNKILSGL